MSSVPPSPLPPEDALRVQPDVMARLDFSVLFGNSAPVEIELGAGDGSFLAEYASRHLDRNFLGVERLLGRLRKLDKKGRRAGLTNLRCLRLEAAYVLEWMIYPGSLSALHVYFPDPWPKRRHWKRRLINADFVRHAYSALAPDGHLFVRTDHVGYFEQMCEVLGSYGGFSRVSTPAFLLEFQTDFERDFRTRGIPTLDAAFVRLTDLQ